MRQTLKAGKSEVRGRKTEDGRQRTEDRGRKTEDGRRMREDVVCKSRGQLSEIRSQKMLIKSASYSVAPISDLRLLISDFHRYPFQPNAAEGES